MPINLLKYVGTTVEMIYVDKHGQISQRIVHVESVDGNTVRAFCCQRQAPRTFHKCNILAIEPRRKKDAV